MSATSSTIELDPAAVSELERSFGGQVLRPVDPGYDEQRRVWNGSVNRFPALIARCAGVADVRGAVRFARRTGLTVAVRSGGHSFPGFSVCNDGVVIDLGSMRGIRVDPDACTVRVQAGARLADLDRETQEFGLAVPAGIVSHTGVAGLTLGGGIGWLMRKHGLTIDQLLAVDVVTADGEFVKASATANAELFWGLRGGGGNFGIVTEFEFGLNPVGPILLAGPIYWPMESSPSVLRFYRDWLAEVPDELTTIVFHRTAPSLPSVPPEIRGKLVVIVGCCYAGPIEEGEAAVLPLRQFGSPLLDLCMPMPFSRLQAMLDPSFLHGWQYYIRSCDVAELTDDVIDITVEHALRMSSPRTTFPIFHQGGAVARVAEHGTAFNGRAAGHSINVAAITETVDGFDAEREWAQGLWAALEPHQTSVYVNFLMDEGEERIRRSYGPETYDRLKALKNSYDPDNFFRLNQNIPPGAER